jgi:hypothetical protein
MAWKVPVSQGNGEFEERENCPAGEWPAVVVALIELGHQQKPDYDDKHKLVWRHMIAVVWEVQGPEAADGGPFYLAEEYTFSLASSANFVKLLNKGGIVVPPSGDCDIGELLGRPFLLTVETAVGKQKGKEYTRLARDGVDKLPQAMRKDVCEPVRPPFCWTVEDGLLPYHSWLPRLYGRGISTVMEAAREFQTHECSSPEDEGEVPASAGYKPASDPNADPF